MPNEVEIKVRTKDESAKGFKSARKGGDDLAKGFDKADKGSLRLSTSVGKVRASIGEIVPVAAVGAAAIVGGAIKSIGAASDLNETLSKSSTIFGANAGTVEAWGKTAANSFGMSEQAAIENASSLGDMFTQMGLGGTRAQQMSTKLVELSGDLASFHNADPSDVIEATTAAFRGEYDSVQRFVPTISAATVQTEAMAETHKKSAAALTNSEKAQATYALLLKGTTAAQGDFARTSNGAANSARRLAAQATDTSAKFGQQLLPAWKGMLNVGHDLIPVLNGTITWFGKLPADAKAAAVGLTVFALAGNKILKGMNTLQDSLERLPNKFSALKTTLSNMGPTGIAAGAGLAVAAVAVTALAVKMEQGKRQAAEYINSLLESSGITDTGEQLQFLAKAIRNNTDGQKLGNQESWQAIVRARELQDKLKAQSMAAALTAKQTDLLTVSTGDAAGGMKDERSAADRLKVSLDELTGKAIDATDAHVAYEDALTGLGETVEENAKDNKKLAHSLDDTTVSGRANLTSITALAKAASSYAQARVNQTGKEDEGRRVMSAARAEFIRTATQLGFNTKRVNELARAYFGIPPTKTTRVNANIGAAEAAVSRIKRALFYLPGAHRVDILVTQNGTVQRVQREINSLTGKAVGIQVGLVRGVSTAARAAGGITGASTGGARGGMVHVGEHGDEFVRLPFGSRVYPHGETPSGMQSAPAGPMTLTVEVTGDPNSWLLKAIRQNVRFGLLPGSA